MALPFDKQRQLELEAQAELELEQEDAANYLKQPNSGLGADYSSSVLGNLGKGIIDTPKALVQLGSDVYDFGSDPIGTIKKAGVEKTARTIGSLASGTAGASAGAPLGVAAGTYISPFLGPFAPLGPIVGGASGAAIGFGAGLLGFDLANDAIQGNVRPTEEYAKNLAYNVGQGLPASAAGEAIGAVRNIKNPLSTTAAETKVGNYLHKLEPDLVNKIDAAYVNNAENPFLNNTPLSELVNSDVLKNVQRTIERSGIEGYGKISESNKLRNTERLKYLDQLEQSSLIPEDVQNTIKDYIEKNTGNLTEEVNKAKENVTSALSDLPTPIDSIEAGSSIRDLAETNKAKIKKEVSDAFSGLGEGQVNIDSVKQIAKDSLAQYFKDVGEQPSTELKNLIDDLNQQKASSLINSKGQALAYNNFSIKDIQALRSKALEIARGGDARSSAVAGKIANELERAGDSAIEQGTISPQEIQSWKEGILKRKEQGRIFESSATPTRSILAKQPYGEYQVPESAIPSKFFKAGDKGAREAIKNYKEAIGNTDEALDPLHRYITDSFREAAVNANGEVNVIKARSWLKRNSEALSELPDLKKILSNTESSQNLLNEKYGNLERSQADVEKGALKQFLQANPNNSIEILLSGKDSIRKISSVVQYLKGADKDAVAGLRRGVIDYLKQKTFIPNEMGGVDQVLNEGSQYFGRVNKNTFIQEWNRIKPAIEKSKLFTDSQLNGLDKLYKDLNSQMSVENAKAIGGSDTIQNNSTLASIIKVAKGRLLKGFGGNLYSSILEPLLQTLPEEKFKAKLEEALFNPRIARDLMQKATTKNFNKNVNLIFKDEIKKASESGLLNQILKKIPYATGEAFNNKNNNSMEEKIKPPTITKEAEVTQDKSFPKPEELLKAPVNLSSLKPETKARISVESSGNPFAESPKGAQGLSQLMPTTAKEIALELGETYMPLTANMTPEQQAASIDQNIRFGDYYYNKMLNRFKNPSLAWAAYNAGPGRISQAIAKAGTDTDVNKILGALPEGVQKETVPYVQKILQRLNSTKVA